MNDVSMVTKAFNEGKASHFNLSFSFFFFKRQYFPIKM